MDQSADWLRSVLQLCKAELSRMIGRNRPGSPSYPELSSVLRQWGIDHFRLRRDLSGSRSAVWLIETAAGLFILRRTDGPDEWLDFQIDVMKHLSNSDFPYEVPQVHQLPNSSAFYFDGRYGWTLFRFLTGIPACKPKNPRQSKIVGTMVGHFYQATKDRKTEERFLVKLFEKDKIADQLHDFAQAATSDRWNKSLTNFVNKNVSKIVSLHDAINSLEIQRFNELENVVIYNDWHNYNMISRRGCIIGLVDFDSIGQAPRIVDFQNALTHILVNQQTINRDSIIEFSEGYRCISVLSSLEVSLMHSVMIDRVASLIAHVLDRVQRERRRSLERQAIRLIRLLSWLGENREQFIADLAPNARS